jgi:hypothetical protein
MDDEKAERPVVEKYYGDDRPHIVCLVDDPVAVERDINLDGWTVGENWSSSDPSQKQPDGRWKLYVMRVEDLEQQGHPPQIPRAAVDPDVSGRDHELVGADLPEGRIIREGIGRVNWDGSKVMEDCRDEDGHVDFGKMFATKCTCGHTLGRHLVVKGEPCTQCSCSSFILPTAEGAL